MKLVQDSWFQNFAVFWILYAFLWVIPLCLNLTCRRFGTLFHLHRQVGVKNEEQKFFTPTCLWRWEQTECSETSACKCQTPGNYAEESIQHRTRLCRNKIRNLYTLNPKQMRWCMLWKVFLVWRSAGKPEITFVRGTWDSEWYIFHTTVWLIAAWWWIGRLDDEWLVPCIMNENPPSRLRRNVSWWINCRYNSPDTWIGGEGGVSSYSYRVKGITRTLIIFTLHTKW